MPPESDPTAAQGATLAQAVQRCRRDDRFMSELAAVLGRAEAAMAERAPCCRACGECCHFDRFDHRLYVSTGELALLGLHGPAQPQPRPPEPRPAEPRPAEPPRCPYQLDRLCTARARRPLGCRVFFCDPALREAGRAAYETFHRQLRLLHRRHGVPYHYVELTAGLAELPAARPLS